MTAYDRKAGHFLGDIAEHRSIALRLGAPEIVMAGKFLNFFATTHRGAAIAIEFYPNQMTAFVFHPSTGS
jgi:hypothetical protein